MPETRELLIKATGCHDCPVMKMEECQHDDWPCIGVWQASRSETFAEDCPLKPAEKGEKE